jgi:phosphopantetheinyl transferase
MTPADTGIELWLVDLVRCAPALEALERDTPRLATDDRERAGAIGDPVERRQRMAAYTALRVVLERVAGIGIRSRSLVRGPGGKPGLLGRAAQFSLSHTEGFALIGTAAAHPIGVDVERTRPLKMPPRRRAELCAVGAGLGGTHLPGMGTERDIIQAWVRLEAFTKARGRPLAQTLADLGMRGKGPEAPPGHLQAAALQLSRDAALAVLDVKLPPGLQGAVAVPAGTRLPSPCLFPPDLGGVERLLLRPGRSHNAGSGLRPGGGKDPPRMRRRPPLRP